MIREKTIRVARESNLGAIYLVKHAPGSLARTSPLAPAMVYLDSLSPSGARSQRVNLTRAANYLSGLSPIEFKTKGVGLDYDWRGLRARHLEYLLPLLKHDDYSPSVIKSTLAALRGVARWAWLLEQMELSDYERLRDVRSPVQGREERRRPARALAATEVIRLFESCEREATPLAIRDACMMVLLYSGGLRLAEATSVTVAAYSRRAHTLTVSGKGDRQRNVYLDDGGARRAIHAWLRMRGMRAGALLCPVNKAQEMLQRQLSARGLFRALERRALKAGVAHFTPHDLRRSFGTHLRDKGVDIDLVRQLLGHVEIRTTQIYLLTSEKQKRQASLKITVPFRTGGRSKRRRRGRRRWRRS